MVLGQSHRAIEEIVYSCLAITALLALRTVLNTYGNSIADMILFCKKHLVSFHKVSGHVKLIHIFNPSYKDCIVLMLAAPIIEQQNS